MTYSIFRYTPDAARWNTKAAYHVSLEKAEKRLERVEVLIKQYEDNTNAFYVLRNRKQQFEREVEMYEGLILQAGIDLLIDDTAWKDEDETH